MRLARVLRAVGRTLITAGVLILLFVAYQLWGTGIREAQAQDRLRDEFEVAVDEARDTLPPASTPDPEPSTAPALPPVPDGDPTAQIQIPRIGVDKTVVEGVSLPNLKQGPGHFPDTPLPGQRGNAAIAGHRTTYGAPFNRIDELEVGDEILVQTVQGDFRYTVTGQRIVAPTDVQVLDDFGDNRLTLIACHPKYSARQRIVVIAVLDPSIEPLPAAPRPPSQPRETIDLDGEEASRVPTFFWGATCAAIWLIAWLVGRRWRRWPAYAIGLPFFAVALFFFFEEFSRLLPSNF